MVNEPTPKDTPKDAPKSITFHYIKSPAFGAVHADGAIGGLTPRGLIHIAFYAERLPIPTQVEQEVLADGTGLGKELEKTGREGVVRELQVDVLMDVNTAEAVQVWLVERVQELKKVIATAAETAHPDTSGDRK